MAIVQRTVQASPQQIFAVLADGWTYSDWVVGTVHIREVDEHWPRVGAELHHKAGPWPLSLQDSSTVLAVEQDRLLKLRAGLWPLGSAVVELVLDPQPGGGTRITMKEDFEAGPLRWARNKINDLVLHRRNIESLRRLTDIVLRSAKNGVRR
ncbi:SRPBCC family protein [Actinoplanes sp. NPDC049599]|uniref:SRPBCC family protein n=1 Tax=Actinoplanes sp. NPDC049599 TaxID=3363903 RepID=UPI0037AD1C4F